jgi:hypothetical protein
MPKRFKQVAVLSGFFSLLVVFVAYRSGAFDRYINPPQKDYAEMFADDNIAFNSAMAVDSPPPPLPDSIKRRVMYSSKSGAVIEYPREERKKDSIKMDSVKKTRTIMRGSKSGPIFIQPDTTPKAKPDSARRRTTMSSSKFGGVIRPVWTDQKGDIVLPTWNTTLRRWKNVKEDHERQEMLMMSGSKSLSMYDSRAFKKEEKAYQLARAIEMGIIPPRNDSMKRAQTLTPRN